MKKLLLLPVLLIALHFDSEAQDLFEKGYFINEEGEKSNVYIDISPLSEHPNFIYYREQRNSKNRIASIDSVKEFYVSGYKFIRYNVEIDLNLKLDQIATPKPTNKTIFLSMELEGNLSLLKYHDDQSTIFFLKVNEENPQQLYSIEFIRPDGFKSYNRIFREQLKTVLNCNQDNGNSNFDINYNLTELRKIIIEENKCLGSESKTYTKSSNFSSRYLNIGFSIGAIKYSFLSTNSIQNLKYSSFADTKIPNIGVEAEYLIPAAKNRLSIWGRLDYRVFEDTDISQIEGRRDTSQLNFQMLELSAGARWYINRSEVVRPFIDISLSRGLPIGEGVNVNYQTKRDFDDPKFPTHFVFGTGLVFKNRYVIDARFEYLDKRFSKIDSQEDVDISIFSLHFKYLIKSYYK